MNKADKLPPHSIEGEQGALGCILYALPDLAPLDTCIATFKAGASVFYDLRHQELYQALCAMQTAQRHVDIITLTQSLKDSGRLESCGGLAYVAGLPEATPSVSNLEQYLGIVLDKFRLRRMLATCADATARAYDCDNADGLLDAFEKNALAIREDTDAGGNSVADGGQSAMALVEHLEQRAALANANKRSGLETGFMKFDGLTDGLQPGEQTIIAARPSQGKTAIGLNIVQRVCLLDRHPTLIVTLEMSRNALMRRLASAWTGIELNSLKSGYYQGNAEQEDRLGQFAMLLKKSPLFIIEGIQGMTSDRLAAIVRQTHRKHGIEFVLVDYLQKIRPAARHEKRTYEVGEISGTLKGLAVETNAAFLTLAQLNREPDKDKGRQPRLADLADSAQIERDADVVAILQRIRTDADPAGRDTALIIAKQRDGELGTVALEFDGAHCLFTSKGFEP